VENPVAATYDELIAFLAELGTERVAHTEGSFLTHLIGVYRDLQVWGCDESLCRAGMFHSIYGTERFQKFALPLERREDVRRLIGDRAERLAYVNCAMDRASFDRAVQQTAGPYSIEDRLTGQPITLTSQDFDDLCRLHLCDWLEQVPRSRHWDYRRSAYQGMAARLGGVAQRSYDAVFAKEPVASA
jgi:Domain of unknown function (DUF6817)